jgi:hypothetical protein
MKKFSIALAAGALAVLSAGAASAHHSAIQFDFTKRVAMKGQVKAFEAINPHMRLVLHVTDAKGTRDIEFEGHSTNNMYRNGYRQGMIKVGDNITVEIAPMKNGSDGGFVQAATTQDGRFFGAKPRAAAAPDAAAAQRAAEGR